MYITCSTIVSEQIEEIGPLSTTTRKLYFIYSNTSTTPGFTHTVLSWLTNQWIWKDYLTKNGATATVKLYRTIYCLFMLASLQQKWFQRSTRTLSPHQQNTFLTLSLWNVQQFFCENHSKIKKINTKLLKQIPKAARAFASDKLRLKTDAWVSKNYFKSWKGIFSILAFMFHVEIKNCCQG